MHVVGAGVGVSALFVISVWGWLVNMDWRLVRCMTQGFSNLADIGDRYNKQPKSPYAWRMRNGGKTHFLVTIPHPSHLISEFSSSCLAAGKDTSIWPVWSNRPDFVENDGIAAYHGAFSFFMQPASTGFAA
jgi:hypothetical protein